MYKYIILVDDILINQMKFIAYNLQQLIVFG
jgi:hypothetical protein